VKIPGRYLLPSDQGFAHPWFSDLRTGGRPDDGWETYLAWLRLRLHERRL